MDKLSEDSKKKSLSDRLIAKYVALANKRSIPLLLIGLVFSSVMLWYSLQLHIQTDLRVLLPSGTASVQALEQSERRMGSTDFFTIACEDSSLERVARFQRSAAESIQRWHEASYVQYDQNPAFFENHALLYFPKEQLRDLQSRLQNMVEQGTSKANPLFVDLGLGSTNSGSADLEGWPNEQALYQQGLPRDVVSSLLRKINTGKGVAATVGTDPALPDSLASRLLGWNAEKGTWVAVVMARLSQPSTEAAFAASMKARGDSLIHDINNQFEKPLFAKVVGAYRDPASEIDQVNADVWLSGIISILAIMALLAFYMHRPANVAVVFVPLLVAMTWMMGATDLLFGRLTVLSSFVVALLSGLGIEYNIHLYSRWIEERRHGLDSEAAMFVSLSRTGRSLVSAMVASIVCMLALQVGHFQGFKEFGVIISIGLLSAFLAAVLLLPPLLFATLQFADWVRVKFGNRFDWFLPASDVAVGATLVPLWKFSPRFLRICFGLAVVFSVFLAFAPRVDFENDFRNLRGKSTGSGIRYGKAMSKGQDARPSIILGQSEEQMREIHAQLGKRLQVPADSMMTSFVTIASFVPSPTDQQERLQILHEIRDYLDKPALQKADSTTRAKIKLLRHYLEPDPFSFADLPDYAQRFLTEADGSHGKFGLVYSDFRESDALEGQLFQERFQSFHTSQGDAAVASSGFIYADVVRMVKADAKKLAGFVFLFLAIVVFLDTRSWRGVVVNMGYVGLISLWSWWIMGYFGWRLGMFNIVVIPALLSNTVDATIHLYHRRMEMGAGKLGEIYHTAGSSVLAGTLTNAFGFSALCFVSHAGLRTIGLLATLGYVTGIVIMFLVMPFLLETLCPKAPQGDHADS